MSSINREIVADNLIKRSGDFTTIDGVSFRVEDEEIVGFMGPNSARKSTTVQMLTRSAYRPRTGNGWRLRHRDAGVALQEIDLDPIMKSLKLRVIQGQLFGMSKRDALARVCWWALFCSYSPYSACARVRRC